MKAKLEKIREGRKEEKKEKTFPILPKKIVVKDLSSISSEVKRGIAIH